MCRCWSSAEDKTACQLEDEQGQIHETTIYKMIRKIEGQGNTSVKLSHYTVQRPASREVGKRDFFELSEIKAHDFVLKAASFQPREQESNKTIFGAGLKRSTFPTSGLKAVCRFRWEKVGKNLKPTKTHVALRHRLVLRAGKPKRVA